jgi:hypothetical protein
MVGYRGRLLRQSLFFKMMRKNHVRPIADMQPVADIDSLTNQRVDLSQQRRRMNHYPITNDGVNPLPKNPGRHEREFVRGAVNDNRVARIRAALVPHHHIVPVAKQIDNLPLSLISPL